MDRLRQLLSYISAQMSLLTVSQRLAIGLCAALIVGSLLWLVQWSTTPEMAPLLTYNFSYEELNAVQSALKEEGIAFTTHGTRVYVRPEDRHEALAVLSAANALPEGSLYDMEALVTNTNPFMSPEQRRENTNYAKGNELAKIITSYPFVQSARVIFVDRTKRRLGRSPDEPTASVTVTLAPGREMTSQVVDGFARLVSGAVAGLKPYNVNIIDSRTGRPHHVKHPDEMGASDYLDQVKQREAHFCQKIMAKLADIPGVLVAVSLELDTSKRIRQINTYGEPQEKKATTHETSQSSATQATESGVQPNTGVAITAGPAGQSSSMNEDTTEMFPPAITETETVEQPPFVRKSVTATVSIPHSFLVGVFMARNPDETNPKDDDPRFSAIRDEQIERVRKSVERIVMADSPEDVEVDIYPDLILEGGGGTINPVLGQAAAAGDGAGGMDALQLVRGYGPQVGLAMLAMASLFMMMRVVRKSALISRAQAKAREVEESVGEDDLLTYGAHSIGEAEVTEGMLAGKEVDEETLRFQELGQEVSKMVEADPSGAADLIRRWVEDLD